MKMYLKNFSIEELEDIYDDVKATVFERTRQMLNDLATVLDFSAEDGNLAKFDDLLDIDTINEINNKLAQRKYLIESEDLKEKLQKLKDNLNYILKDIDSIGLSDEYNRLLDDMLNPDLRAKCKK